ncbi:MAG: glycoside hydrolase family 2 protein [Clostridia bacterium]|nr:glycoside hydrolase family 2 protein [Clostridia bacterium]
MELKNWTFYYRDYQPLACTAPCSMYGILLENNIIEDPFWRDNEEKYLPFSDYPCEFRCDFEIENKSKFSELIFRGLDTICDIYLNGCLLDSVKNMHRTFAYDVADLIVIGKNTVRLVFSSPTEYFKQMEEKHHLYVSDATLQGASHLRKALCMSGWDWGPMLPDMGIFQPVELKSYDVDYIDNFEIHQVHREGKVILKFSVLTKHKNADCDISVSADNKTVRLEHGIGEIVIENPELWWPRGYGKQSLYEICAELAYNGKVTDRITKRVGLRTVTVSTKPDECGNEFCIVVNGVKIFAMGANYIPQDNILSRVTPEKIKEIIDSCVFANYNSLRVWGGGYYPSDYFYDLCDENGILLWQDMMIACANIWLIDSVKENLIAEFTEQLKRFAHHACLGIIGGNNEMEVAVIEWNAANNSELVRHDYLELYERILPELCEKYAPEAFYWPSSPSSGGGFDNPGDYTRGDQHCWEVWHGNKPYEEYGNHKMRFCSEFGFESFPSMKTIKEFALPEDCNPFSKVMECHQKSPNGNTKIITYMADKYLYPSDFENVIYASQINQAEAIKYGVEHFRRNREFCKGAIYWQINDCWPAISWSSVDWFGRYKALHYEARRFFAPVLCSCTYENNMMTVNVANETMSDFHGSVRMFICRNDFTVVEKKEAEVCIKALTSENIGGMSDKIVTDKTNMYFYAELYDDKNTLIMRRMMLFDKPKYYKWEDPAIMSEVIQKEEDLVQIRLKSKCLAKGVEVDFENADVILSDNYVDIVNGDPVVLEARTNIAADDLHKQLTLKSVYNLRADVPRL